jgi:prepilin-type N-terminal cleavage/methylation domain-containing protein
MSRDSKLCPSCYRLKKDLAVLVLMHYSTRKVRTLNFRTAEDKEHMFNREKGFSLIELLIVVAIILIIAAIAIPNLLRSRIAANEASAVGSVRTMNTAAVAYSSTYGNGFPPTLAAMGTGNPPAANASCNESQLVDNVLSSGTKSGYTFTYTMGNADATTPAGCAAAGGSSYFVTAVPQTVGQTGQRSFCSDQSGVIRFDPAGNAIASDAACLALSALQ